MTAGAAMMVLQTAALMVLQRTLPLKMTLINLAFKEIDFQTFGYNAIILKLAF